MPSTRGLLCEDARREQYLRATLPYLRSHARAIARTHGDRDPSFREVACVLEVLAAQLSSRVCDEERVREVLAQLRTRARDYVAPGWAGHGVRLLMRELAHLDATLRRAQSAQRASWPRAIATA